MTYLWVGLKPHHTPGTARPQPLGLHPVHTYLLPGEQAAATHTLRQRLAYLPRRSRRSNPDPLGCESSELTDTLRGGKASMNTEQTVCIYIKPPHKHEFIYPIRMSLKYHTGLFILF